MHRLGMAAALIAMSSCSVLGPDAASPALLQISGTVENVDGLVNEPLEVVLTWYLNARPNEPFLLRAERAPVDNNGRFELTVRALPPAEARLPSVEAFDANPARIAIGFLDIASAGLDARSLSADSPALALVFPGAPPPGLFAAVGWHSVSPESGEIVPLGDRWTNVEVFRTEPTEPFWRPCGLLAEDTATAAAERDEAEDLWAEADSTWCEDPEENSAAFSSCGRLGDYLCEPRCNIQIRTLVDDEGYPRWWPCDLAELPCDPFRDPDVVACQEEIDGPPVVCEPDDARWVVRPSCTPG